MNATRIHLHVASSGNEVMTHIAGMLVEGFGDIGIESEVIVDGLPLESASRGRHSIVVAPHEYFPLHFLRTRPTIELAPTLASCSILNVEQPRGPWFEIAWDFARQAGRVFDISEAGVAEFERRGVAARYTPLGWTAALVAPTQPPILRRPVDVLFLGHESPRRSAFFARHAAFFSGRNCHLRFSDVNRPRTAATTGVVHGPERLQMVASSKILLSVHSSERPYFEQHRALLALANGTALVTETSRYTYPLRDGDDFVSAPLDDLPAVCERLLTDPTALQRIATSGRQAAEQLMPLRTSCRAIQQAIEQDDVEARTDLSARRSVSARLQEAAARRAAGQLPWTVHENEAYAGSPVPAVSVVVSLFNYRQYVGRTLRSVNDAEKPAGGVELVVVDDASTDGSAETVADWMRPVTLPVLLVRKDLNTGLADVRNAGFQLARAPRVFVLDADNWVYPTCLMTLEAALRGSPHAAAYGQIARVEEETGDGIDLLSAFDWSPRRLVEGPYLDAMAMFDRAAVLGVGGYSTELIEHGWFGWEDYDLWLKLAQAGCSCRLVPRVLAGYRDHRQSMLRRTNRSSAQLAKYFAVKFASLVAQHPDASTHFAYPRADATEMPRLEREIEDLRDHVIALERQLAAVYASASWRVTAPLRKAIDWIGRRR